MEERNVVTEMPIVMAKGDTLEIDATIFSDKLQIYWYTVSDGKAHFMDVKASNFKAFLISTKDAYDAYQKAKADYEKLLTLNVFGRLKWAIRGNKP
jgi:hypothetical protein